MSEHLVCDTCEALRRLLVEREDENAAMARRVLALEGDLREAGKLIEAQQADLDRYKAELDRQRPNCPERVPEDQLQLAFARVIETLGQGLAVEADRANDNAESESQDAADPDRRRKKRRHAHGRRPLDTSNLPTKTLELDPEEVLAAGGNGYRLVGQEVAHRVAYQRAGYIRLTVVRRKWARVGADADSCIDPLAGLETLPLPPVVIAETPSCMWPRYMADPSAIANVAVSKYGDILPLHRQETISARDGFTLPRSTQCGWLKEAHRITYRIVEAMADEARTSAFCIATDATGAPVKSPGGCEKWHVFVFVADRDHVFFRYTDAHRAANVSSMLEGFGGYLLADAAKIYDALYQPGKMVEVGCWYHQRKYFWKALESDPVRAYEALSLIAKLFRVARECADLPMPERTRERAARAGPILELLDRWIETHRGVVDPRGSLDAAITYYDNQREALRRFLEDGRLPLDNSVSERGLRNLVLGRANWLYFANDFFASSPPEIVAAYLFGSTATGTARPDSDVDVAVLYRAAPPPTLDSGVFDLEADLSRHLGKEAQLVVLNGAPVDLVHRVLMQGRLVLDRDKSARIRFEVESRNEYFDLLAFLRRYRRLPADPP